jgi:MFS family permease
MKNVELLKNRGFSYLLLGQMMSEFGSAISAFLLPWIILHETGSAMHMGFIWGLGFLSYLIFLFPAGVWVDRYNRKHLMIISDIGRMGLLLVLIWLLSTGSFEIWHMYLIRVGISFFTAIFENSYVAALPSIVTKDELYAANGLITSVNSIVSIAGLAVAGLIVINIGVTKTLIIDLMTFGASILSLLAIKEHFSSHAKPKEKGLFKEMVEGVKYTWDLKIVRYLALLTTGVNLSLQAGLAVLLFRLEKELHMSSNIASLVMTGITIGVLIGSLVASKLLNKVSIRQVTIMVFAVLGFCYLALAYFEHALLIIVFEILVGFWVTIWNVQVGSTRQKVVPSELLGRVSSGARAIAFISIPIGASLGGVIAESKGVPLVFLLCGSMSLILALYSMTLKKENLILVTESAQETASN